VTRAVQRIERHDIDLDIAAEQAEELKEGIEYALSRVERSPRDLNRLLSFALMRARYLCASDPRVILGPTWEAFTLPMQAATAIFSALNAEEQTVSCRVDIRVRNIPKVEPQYWTGAANWLMALWLAIICREKDRTDMLCATPVHLLRDSESSYDDFVFLWVETLQMLWNRQEQGLFEKLVETIRATDPDTLRVAPAEMVLEILFPPMKLLGYLIQGEVENFNSALTESVELHKRYWTATAERAKDPDGYIAFGPLAMACLAHEYGMPVDVESPYIPDGLISGDWVGEFRT
jgi:hypothetical protein